VIEVVAMRESLRLGRIGGTDIRVHWTVPTLAVPMAVGLYAVALPSAVAGRSSAAYGNAAVQIVMLALTSLVAHELAHVLVTHRYRVAVRNVTILPVGGWAEPDGVVPTRAELVVAAVGPAVNVLRGRLSVTGTPVVASATPGVPPTRPPALAV
jgi:Zn-dependent protease